MIYTIANIMLCIMGMVAIWFLYHKQKWMRWGYIIGLCSEPFWFIAAWESKSWGIIVLCFVYTYCYSMGIYNYWIKEK